MFCFQRKFGLPTEVVTLEQFEALLSAPQTASLVKEAREALEKGDKATYDRKKKQLPFVIFIATYEEWNKVFVNKETHEETTKRGCWRSQEHCRLNGLCVIDYDHIEGDVRKVWDEAFNKLSEEDKQKILFVYVTPSGHGLKVVFMADPAIGNLIDNQIVLSLKMGELNPDKSCSDGSRGAFLTTIDDVIFIDKEKLINYENEEFGKKYNESYHAGHSQCTIDIDKARADYGLNPTVQAAGEDQQPVSGGDGGDQRDVEPLMELSFKGMPYSTIIDEWWQQNGGLPQEGERNIKLYQLAVSLRAICDNNKELLLKVMPRLGLSDVELSSIVDSACKETPKGLSKAMKAVLGALGGTQGTDTKCACSDPQPPDSGGSEDVYASLPLDKWAEELQEMAEYYPCMKELFINVHPHKLAAVWFSSAALFGTLMTRAWYHFWYEPEIVRRLNYCIFIIGDPGAGKNIVEKFYKKIADPMIQADQCLIDAVNRYKDNRTERTTSTKAQKGEALKRPIVPIRVHPARTATGEFIRHMNAAVEIIQGQPLHLHMFSFDAELDNVTKQNKGGDWKDREILELKAFHNEEDGQMYANQESVTGMFNIYWNFIYTGTPYALHRKVNQRNFGTGMSTRLAVIPLPDKGLAKRHQKVDPHANETLKQWSYRLDKMEGEIPIEPLNDETYDWQSSRMEIAEFNDDKADRTLLKRVPYYGIGISLPFILMRHWEEWQEHKTLTMDDRDRRLCRLAMEIQYKCQQFYFGEMAYNYFADQNKEFVQRRRSTRYDECFRKLPEEFKTQQFIDCFGCSNPTASRAITRFIEDHIVEKVKYGLYRKLVNELP